MSSGTSASMRYAEALEHTPCPACANAGSIARLLEREGVVRSASNFLRVVRYFGREKDLQADVEPVMQFSCRDRNRIALQSDLLGAWVLGIQNVLSITGDLPCLGDQPHDFAYQSAAISNEPWLGPDVSVLIERYAAQGQRNIISCPIGFVCEHVEVLYDIDIVYQKLARSLGVRLERIEMVHTEPKMIAGMAELVRQTAKEANWL